MPFWSDPYPLADEHDDSPRLVVTINEEEPLEAATDEFKSLDDALSGLKEHLDIVRDLQPQCESPIEMALGAPLRRQINRVFGEEVRLQAQYRLNRYRYDFAVLHKGRLCILIECDGKEFHSTPEQLANDRRKDAAAAAVGALILRFTGRDIYKRTDACIAAVLDDIFRQRGVS